MGLHIHIFGTAKIFDKFCLIIISGRRRMTRRRETRSKDNEAQERLEREKTLWPPPPYKRRKITNSIVSKFLQNRIPSISLYTELRVVEAVVS